MADSEGPLAATRILPSFESAGDGCGIVDACGDFVWESVRLHGQPASVRARFTEACAAFLQQGDDRAPPHARSQFRSENQHFEVIVSRCRDERALGVLLNVTSRTRLSQRLDAVDAAGAELLDLDAQIVNPLNVAERLALLEGKIAHTLATLFGNHPFEVRLRNRKTDQLELVIGHGIDPLRIGESLFAREQGNGISGWVAATGESYICRDPDNDPLYLPGLPGARSSLTAPLLLRQRVIGVVNVEALAPNAFDDNDRLALETYGRYQAMGLNILDMLIVERSTTSERVSATLRDELEVPQQCLRQATRDLAAGRLGAYESLEKALEMLSARIRGATAGPQTVLGIDRLPRDRSRDPAIDGRRILVADDDANVRETIQALLQEAGGIVESRADGSSAIDLMERGKSDGRPFELIISDVRMPDRNGYEVFRAARELIPNCRFLMMTGFGYDPNHSIVRSSQDGLNNFLFKPFQAQVLLEEVRKALGAPA